MPRIGSLAELDRLERKLDERDRYVDLAVRLRVLADDGSPGPLRPELVGGRWDSWEEHWTEQPDDLQAVEWTIQQQQLDVFFGIPWDTSLVAIFAGRQAGKTFVGLQEVVRDALRWPGWESFIVSQDFKASTEIKSTLEAMFAPSWGVEWVASEKHFRFPHGHLIKLRSAENPGACRGPSTKTLLLDEAALMPYEAYLSAVGSGMASKWFRLLITTTPRREVPWIRQIYQDWGKADLPGTIVRHLKTELNPRRNERLLEIIRRSTPADIYEQEFKGELVPPESAVYARLFRRDVHLQPAGHLPESMRFWLPRNADGSEQKLQDWTTRFCQERFGVAADYLIGWDFGREAAVVAKVFRATYVKVDELGKRTTFHRLFLWFVGEVVDDNLDTEGLGLEVAEKFGTNAVVITDAIGAHDNASGRPFTAAPIKVLRRLGFRLVRPVDDRNPSILHRVTSVRHLLRNCNRTDEEPEGEVRAFVAPGACPRLQDALENQQMIHGLPEKDDHHEHPADAAGYLVCATFPVPVDVYERRAA